MERQGMGIEAVGGNWNSSIHTLKKKKTQETKFYKMQSAEFVTVTSTQEQPNNSNTN